MANDYAQMLNPVFGEALAEAGLRSWAGPTGSDTKWLASRLGDLYLHETVISHIRRLLMQEVVCARVDETYPKFKRHMLKVQDFTNSDAFRREPDGAGLLGLAKDVRKRCEELKGRHGQRSPY